MPGDLRPFAPDPVELTTYRIVRANGVGRAVSEFPRSALIQLIEFPEHPLRGNGCETVKLGNSSLVVKTEFPVATGHISVAYKRLHRKTLWTVVTASVRRSRASHAWKLGHALIERGISTPRPIAVVLPRKRDVTADAYLATEWIDGSTTLAEFLRRAEFFDAAVCRRMLNETANSLGRLLGRMHAAGVRHRDLKPSNLLIVESGSHRQAMLIDLDGAALGRRVSRRVRCRNLSRLILGTTDEPAVTSAMRLRCLKSYLRAAGVPHDQWKSYWRELGHVTLTRAAHKSRRAA